MKNKIFRIIAIIICVISVFAGVFYCTKYYNTERKLNEANNSVLEVQNMLAENNSKIAEIENELSNVVHELENTDAELIVTKEALQEELHRVIALNEVIGSYECELQAANAIISDLKGEEYEFIYIGDYKLTHYCTERYAHICGTGSGLTATGTTVTTGRTIAVDPSVIPYGATVYIEGYGIRIAEDCGGSVNGNHIDIAVDTHSEALNLGTKYNMGVWVLVKKTT